MSDIEQIIPGFTRQFLHDGQIVVYTVTDIKRSVLAAWAQTVKETGDSWDKNKPYRSLQDFSGAPITTPFLRDMAEQVNAHFMSEGFPASYIAVVVPASVFGEGAAMFVRRGLESDYVERQVFSSRSEALTWLESSLKSGS